MQLNFLERLFILSPLRRFLQDHFETRRLFEMGGSAKGARVLEVGCGPGFAIDLLYNQFNVSSVDAFDVDPKMVSRVQQRQNEKNRKPLLWVGNVRHIPVINYRYDAVFNFGAIHHVVDWRAALGEIHRVMKPGGQFYCEEILSRYITHPLIGRLMDHPQKDRFDEPQFIDALQNTGFRIESSRQLADLYLWVVATKA
mgnify:CR=1 FL=1|jgi:ubiquinone/menaquinone biosynthesis C-methylase UbiE